VRTGPAGNIAFVLTADAIDERGRPTGVHRNFLPQAHSITALVQVGNLGSAPQTLTVEWLQDHRGKTPTALFKHTIKVGPGDRAFSTAVAVGFIRQGDYRITADIAGTRVTVPFYVRPDPPTAAPSPNGAASLPPGLGDNPQSGPSGDIPVNSGATPSAPSGCQLSIDASSVTSELTDATGCAGDTWVVDAEAGGPVARIGGGTGDGIQVSGVDPCKVAGSDVPGSRFTYSAHVVGGPDTKANATAAVVLGPDTRGPTIAPESTPEPGSVVRTGDQITLTVTVDDSRAADEGVTGIASISVSSPDGVLDQHTYDARRACDPAGLQRSLYVIYTVPGNPADVITLTIAARDQAGNAENVDVQYLTKAEWIGGGVFNGTSDSHFVYDNADYGAVDSHCDGRWALQVDILVKGTGPIHGKAIASRISVKCSTSTSGSKSGSGSTETSVGPTEGTLNVDGDFDGKAFTLDFSPAPLANGYFEGDFDYYLNLDLLFYPHTVKLPLKNENTTADIDISVSGPAWFNGCPAGAHDCQGTRTLTGYLSLSATKPT